MRIRKLARLLISDKKDDVPQSERSREDVQGNSQRKKVAEEIISMDENLNISRPIGDVIKVSGEGKKVRNYFASFNYKGVQYDIEDFVMFWSGKENQKPYVAIIKEIIQKSDGSMMLKVQWFYRPEDTEKSGGGIWESSETRELYYSFHLDETNVESIMHKCVVNFIPLDKQIPSRKQHPGFIVQKVYDPKQKKLFKFTDNVYAKNKKEQINLLIQKTSSRIGELLDKNNNINDLKKRKNSSKEV